MAYVSATTIPNESERTIGNKTYKFVTGANMWSDGSSYYNYNSDSNTMQKLNPSLYTNAKNMNRQPEGTVVQALSGVEDGGMSQSIAQSMQTADANFLRGDTAAEVALMHSHNIFSTPDIFNKRYRFGYFNMEPLTNAKEILFFTKPDLNIASVTGENAVSLNNVLKDSPFFIELAQFRPEVMYDLEWSLNEIDPFNHLLANQCISNLDIPGLTAEMQESATNSYGVSLSYRGSSEASDDKHSFSLEFKDNKWLQVYYFFKAYEKYETMKHHGAIEPRLEYIENHILHDQFCIFKFLVDEDMETILYYGKMYGVTPKTLPRDVFSSPTFDNGLSYSIDFEAAFYEDMEPDIISDFNAISAPYYRTLPYRIDIYNDVLHMVDNRPARAAMVERVKSITSPTGFVYKLRWRGDDQI